MSTSAPTEAPTGKAGFIGWARRLGARATMRSLPLSWYLNLSKYVAALPLVAATFVLVGVVVNGERAAKRFEQVGEAKGLADVVGRELDKYFLLSNVLAHSAYLKSGDLQGFKTLMESNLSQMPSVTVAVFSPDGQVAAVAPSGLAVAQDAALAKEAARRGVSALSDVRIDPGSGAAFASIETPVSIGGGAGYELSVQFTLDRFESLLKMQEAESGYLTGIVDRDGVFVARQPVGAGKPGGRASDEFRAAARSPPRTTTVHATVDGENVESAYAATRYGWTVGVARAAPSIGEIYGTPFLAALMVAAALGTSALLSHLSGRRLAMHIRNLQRLSSQLAAEQPISAPRIGVAELDELSDALVATSKNLSRRARQQESAEEALRRSEEHFRLLADSLPQLVWTAGADGRIEYTNARRSLYGAGDLGRADWDTIIHPDDRRSTAETWLRASEAGTLYQKEHRLLIRDRGYVWHLSRAEPLLAADGAVIRWYGTTTDINDAKMREEHIRTLMAEVNHRSRNLLAVALSIARRSATSGETATDFERKFSERLRSLVAGQDLLTGSEWRGVWLEPLIRAQCFSGLPMGAARVTLTGPPLLLNPSATQTLGLALHELGSNARRHGALSTPAGKVDVTWRFATEEQTRRFVIEWRERDGPPIAVAPTLGFGSVLIDKLAAQGLGGVVDLRFEPTGLYWRLSAPLDALAVAT